MSLIGRSVKRLEDRPLLTGSGRFAADITFPDTVYMRVVRSPYAHGLIKHIDAAAARALPGVVAGWTTADIADLPPIEFREGPIAKLAPFRQHVLARDRVRYVGEPVAVVFATDAYVAEDAAELVRIDVEEIDPILDAAAAPGDEKSTLATSSPGGTAATQPSGCPL